LRDIPAVVIFALLAPLASALANQPGPPFQPHEVLILERWGVYALAACVVRSFDIGMEIKAYNGPITWLVLVIGAVRVIGQLGLTASITIGVLALSSLTSLPQGTLPLEVIVAMGLGVWGLDAREWFISRIKAILGPTPTPDKGGDE
jgi:hypothetical protein